jgi:hypothetical protein
MQLSFNDFIRQTTDAARRLVERYEEILLESKFVMEENAKKNASSDFYDSAYQRSGRKRPPRPGVPSGLTGRLRSSIKGGLRRKGGILEATVQAGSAQVNYASALEFGTRDRRIAPFLFIGKAVRQEQRVINEMFEGAIVVAMLDNKGV